MWVVSEKNSADNLSLITDTENQLSIINAVAAAHKLQL